VAPKVSEEHKENRKHLLLDSALKCFASRGYESTTIDDIVHEAGVSKGMFYNYFRSKEEMYLELLENRTSEWFAELRLEFATCRNSAEKLKLLVQRFREWPLNVERRQSLSIQLEFILYSSRSEELTGMMRNRYERHIEFLEKILEEGKNSGEFPANLDPRSFAAAFWALRDGISLHYTMIGGQQQYEQVTLAAEELLFHALSPHAPL
jgi:AcrR family transcriptional regulator